MSEPTIYQLLNKVMAEVQSVAKTERNASQGFNFRGIDAVVNAVAPALRKHDVLVFPVIQDYTYNTVEVGKNRTAMAHVIVRVRYIFAAPNGENIYTEVIGEAMDSGDKAVAKAMSVAFRIALLQALALPTDEPDPDHSTYERAPAKPEADSATVERFKASLGTADTIEELDRLGAAANGYALTEEQRLMLRDIYKIRKTELESEVN